jgi:ATP-dependent exoDNAse (exonuclease V) beta subunit
MFKKIKNVALMSAAGAGKTRALTRRFLFLYLNQVNFPLDSLYGITFTNEAAFEMKERIMRYLELLISGHAEDDSEKDIIGYFTEAFPNIKERAVQKKQYLLNNLSDLNISTFHHLFASFLSSVPFAAGLLPGYEIIDETEDGIIFDGVLDNFFENIDDNKDVVNIIGDLLAQQETRIKQSIKNIFRNIGPWIEYLERLVDQEESIKKRLLQREMKFIKVLKKFNEFIKQHESCGYTKSKRSLNKNLADFCAKIDEFLQNKNLKILHNSIFGTDLATKNYIHTFLKNLGDKSGQLIKILDDLEIVTDEYLNSLSDQQILIYLKPVLNIHQQFRKEKREQNMLSFDDIEMYTLEALKNNPEPDYLYFKIGAEIRHLMIDEFQDTSHRQLEVLNPLISEITSVEPEEKSFFYVGDPHQAIFRWRGGAPELFNLLIDKYQDKISEEKLIINYRSKDEIINFVNKVLDKDDKTKPGNTGGWLRVEDCGGFDDSQAGDDKIRQRVAEIIGELHKKYNYEYSDIAVLVKTNKFGVAMADELTKSHIPFVSKSRAVILNDDDVRLVLHLLKFLDDPENNFSLMHVLLSPIFKIKEETLRSLLSLRKTLYMGLRDAHPGWEATKILNNLLPIVHFCNPYQLIYRIYKELRLKISYPLATLMDVALDYTRNGFNSLSSFIAWSEIAGDSIEIKKVHPEGVKILTVHKAKGLEFEVVIIPETNWNLPRYENRQLLFSYTEDGARPEKIYWRSYGRYFQRLKDAEQERLKNDELNLLYVALTRAKNGIYVLGYNYLKRGYGFWINTISEKVGSTQYALGDIIKKEKLRKETEKEKAYGVIQEKPLVIKEERTMYSPTERGVQIIDTALRREMEFGSMVHQALSRIEWLDGFDVDKIIDDVMEYIKDLYARRPEERDKIEEKVKPLLTETLTDPDLRTLFFKGNRSVRCKNELPIYFEDEKRDVSGYIDRLIIEGEKTLIIDYKTGEEKPEYKHQMQTYKKGVGKIYPGKLTKTLLVYLERERGKKIVEI